MEDGPGTTSDTFRLVVLTPFSALLRINELTKTFQFMKWCNILVLTLLTYTQSCSFTDLHTIMIVNIMLIEGGTSQDYVV